MRLGSRNTRFFHAQTIVRRKRNKIHGLHLPSGEWCTNPKTLQEEAVKFFKQLFCTKEVVGGGQNCGNICPLSAEGRRALSRLVTKDEVHRAIMSMKSYKALGPDGFQPVFYKTFWDVVGDDVWRFVRDSFQFGQFTHPASDTLMVLIPKIDAPTNFKEFRPILVFVMSSTRLSPKFWSID